jgi:hypothetical protein
MARDSMIYSKCDAKYVVLPSYAVLDDNIAGMQMSKRWEASFLEKEKSLKDLTSQSLDLKKR